MNVVGGTPKRVILDIALYDLVESKSEIARGLAEKWGGRLTVP
ncbi:hypothetical protein [Bacillus wiedmannii]|nr:hypothetical protein [Bacillus wiedmannii]